MLFRSGGTSIYSGTQFDVTVSRMIGACVAGELSKAYIDILVFDKITYEPISIDSLVQYYYLSVLKDGEPYLAEQKITRSMVTVIGDVTKIRLSDIASGMYQITIKGDGTYVKGSRISAIKVESIGHTALTWIGAMSGDFNEPNNWRYQYSKIFRYNHDQS